MLNNAVSVQSKGIVSSALLWAFNFLGVKLKTKQGVMLMETKGELGLWWFA